MSKILELFAAAAALEFLGGNQRLPFQVFFLELAQLNGDLCTATEDSLHRRREPTIDRALQQIRGDEEDEDHWHKRETDVGQHELRSESAAEDTGSALDNQFQQITQENEAEDEDQRDVQIPQDKEQDTVGQLLRRSILCALQKVERSGGENQQENECAD